MQQKSKAPTIIAVIIILLAGAGFAFWYFFMNGPGSSLTPAVNVTGTPGYTPFGRIPQPANGPITTSTTTNNGATTINQNPGVNGPIPTLRMLSGTPVGGYGASTTASTTIIRWLDRGKGDIYEAAGDSTTVTTLSNTTLPRVYQSVWNKTLTAFVGSMLPDGGVTPTTIYAELKKHSAVASTSNNELATTPFELKGNNLPSSIVDYAISPKADKVFLFANENGTGSGYVANLNGSSLTRIFTTPLTQINISWPETNTIAITTKGSISQPGFLYFVDPKTGAWKKILGPIAGLSAVVSHDGKYVIASSAGHNQDVETAIFDVTKGSYTDAIFKTLADKCAWGNFYKEIVYCAVPSQPVSGAYPDDWYQSKISTADKIWQTNVKTGEIHLVSSIVDQSDRTIDIFNMGLDAKDNYLMFMNKDDLSLWLLNLISSH